MSERFFNIGAVRRALHDACACAPLRFPLRPEIAGGIAMTRMAATFAGVSDAVQRRALQTACRMLALPEHRVRLLCRDGDTSLTVQVMAHNGEELGRKYVEGIDWETGDEIVPQGGLMSIEVGTKVAVVKVFKSMQSPPILMRGTVMEVHRGVERNIGPSGLISNVLVPKRVRVRWSTGSSETLRIDDQLLLTGADEALDVAVRVWRSNCRSESAGEVERLRTAARTARASADALMNEAEALDKQADVLLEKWGARDEPVSDADETEKPIVRAVKRGRPSKTDR